MTEQPWVPSTVGALCNCEGQPKSTSVSTSTTSFAVPTPPSPPQTTSAAPAERLQGAGPA
eukprot:1644531-Rhodomonas_salina.1